MLENNIWKIYQIENDLNIKNHLINPKFISLPLLWINQQDNKMALNNSGPISLGGSVTGQSIALELGLSATAQISLNNTNVRSLAGVASGAITMPTNFYGKGVGFSFTIGQGGAGGSGASNGSNGQTTTFVGPTYTVSGTGGEGGYYNTPIDSQGGVGSGFASRAGGTGGGVIGDSGGGGGGAINGVNSTYWNYPSGQTGANPSNVVLGTFNTNLNQSLILAGYSLGAGGSGANANNDPIDGKNGSNGSLIGSGGGGAGWYGGNGGSGGAGGGGGGAAGYGTIHTGGGGGQGFILITWWNSSNVASASIYFGSNTWAIPATAVKFSVFAVGGGGGGAGVPAGDSFSGGGGGAGGIGYGEWFV